LDAEELERFLRSSSLTYPFKDSWLIDDVQQTPCLNCPFEKEYPPVPLLIREQKCFERCPRDIIVWILNEKQTKIYEKFRPDVQKKEDMALAINARKIALVEQTMGRAKQ